MCGLAGVVQADRADAPVSSSTLVAMRDALVHRGPDDAGVWLGAGCALASRRLSIVDLSERGRMPMTSPDGRYVICQNGEVYNHKSLRRDLEARGVVFRSDSDTEVLLHLFMREGPAMLSRLNGMFAIAIWDTKKRALFLARDRLGVKPLYLAFRGDSLWFASEEKALFAGGVPATFDDTKLAELLSFRYVAGEETPFRGVRRLLPGHYLEWCDGRSTTRRWWNLGEIARERRDAHVDDAEYRALFDDAVGLRRIADVPVGVMLSGGLDSSSVAASIAGQAAETVHSFTVGFAEAGFDETPLARDVARKHHLELHEIRVDPKRLLSLIERASFIHDEPLAHSNDAHMLVLSDVAKPRVTILLSGEGADETLAGYVRYFPLRFGPLLEGARPIARRIADARLPHRMRKLARMLRVDDADGPLLWNGSDLFPDELTTLGLDARFDLSFRRQRLDEGRRAYPRDGLRQAMYLDQHTFLVSLLDRNDRMTMGASIECRTPFLDYRLVELAASLPTRRLIRRGKPKAVLRDALGARLPDSVLHGRKWGFGIPWARYFREVPDLRDRLRSVPSSPLVKNALDGRAVERLVAAYMNGDTRAEPAAKALFLLSTWHDTYFARVADLRGVRDEAAE